MQNVFEDRRSAIKKKRRSGEGTIKQAKQRQNTELHQKK
jgi:hypothetical protein